MTMNLSRLKGRKTLWRSSDLKTAQNVSFIFTSAHHSMEPSLISIALLLTNLKRAVQPSYGVRKNFVVDSAEPIKNVKYFIDTLRSSHRQHWKEAIYEHYNKNANVALCFMPFPGKKLFHFTQKSTNQFYLQASKGKTTCQIIMI